MKKLVALLLAAMMLVACIPALAEQPEGYPEVVEGIDFGGADLVINYYWNPDPRKEEPSEEEQAQYDYRDWIMETYNVNVVEQQKGDWTTNVQELTNFCTTPDGTLCVYVLPPDFVGTPMANDLFAAWDFENVDLTADKWNDSTLNFMTKGGKVYGVATGNSEPRQCLYFNKRILEEAGIDPETVYDMQAEGTWTWEAFEDMLKKIHRDTDNDGVIDIYGMTGNNSDMYMMGVVSNGGKFFRFNDAGELEIAVNSDAALEGLAWTKDIFANYFYQQPADGAWDYFKDAWNQAFCGFYMYQTYGGFNDQSEFTMEDEWGCVAFPIGPKGDKYVNIVSDNVTVIPNVYDAETAAKIAYIYDLWTNATPGYDNEDAWIGNKYNNACDDRAVDETYAMLREPEHCVANLCLYLGSVNDILGSPLLWQLAGGTPAELVEAATPAWQALCDTFNGK